MYIGKNRKEEERFWLNVVLQGELSLLFKLSGSSKWRDKVDGRDKVDTQVEKLY